MYGEIEGVCSSSFPCPEFEISAPFPLTHLSHTSQKSCQPEKDQAVSSYPYSARDAVPPGGKVRTAWAFGIVEGNRVGPRHITSAQLIELKRTCRVQGPGNTILAGCVGAARHHIGVGNVQLVTCEWLPPISPASRLLARHDFAIDHARRHFGPTRCNYNQPNHVSKPD